MKPITIQPRPCTDPPDVDTTVLVSDGYEVFCGYYDDRDGGQWYDCTAAPIAGGIWWAHLPDPGVQR